MVQPDPHWRAMLKSRLLVAAGALVLWVAGIEARLVILQVVQHDELVAKAERQQMSTVVAPAKRGAWPLGIAGVYDIDDAHLAQYAKAARTREGFQRYLEEFVCTPAKSYSPASSPA